MRAVGLRHRRHARRDAVVGLRAGQRLRGVDAVAGGCLAVERGGGVGDGAVEVGGATGEGAVGRVGEGLVGAEVGVLLDHVERRQAGVVELNGG